MRYQQRAKEVCLCLAVFFAGHEIGHTADADRRPDWSGWWEFNGELPSSVLARNPPPLRPDHLNRVRAGRINPDSDPDPLRFCRPPQFLGESGSIASNLEILFTEGRVTIVNEAGLLRRIYTDGRSLPNDPEESSGGTSVGRWEGQTLVVTTVGINSKARFPDRAPGALPIGKGVRITESITLKDADTLEFDVTIEAPEIFTAPDRRKIPFVRSTQIAAREISACTDFDRSVDPVTGKQRFDMTPPADLPPPPQIKMRFEQGP